MRVNSGGGYFFATYMKDALSQIKQYDKTGKLVREIKLPGNGTAGGFGGENRKRTVLFIYQHYAPTIFKFNVDSGKSEVYQKPKVKFNPENYVSEQVFYTSADGTKIPMMISYKKD